jgi:hypothetical protein
MMDLCLLDVLAVSLRGKRRSGTDSLEQIYGQDVGLDEFQVHAYVPGKEAADFTCSIGWSKQNYLKIRCSMHLYHPESAALCGVSVSPQTRERPLEIKRRKRFFLSRLGQIHAELLAIAPLKYIRREPSVSKWECCSGL